MREDLTGCCFGHLDVLTYAGSWRLLSGGKSLGALWLCRCRCKAHKELTVSARHLRLGHTTSCGCAQKDAVVRSNKRRSGVASSSWKGGRVTDSAGYVRVMCKEHPNTTSTGYVLEHRLVMEKYLGRYLFPDETVHHKNGVKCDNRIENLELWSSRHPKGQRVIDTVAWAMETLDRYASSFEVLSQSIKQEDNAVTNETKTTSETTITRTIGVR